VIDFLQTHWNRISLPGRITFIGSCILILFMVLGLFWWATRTDYQPLFTDMAEQDMSAAITALDKQKVPYIIAQDGKSILIDKNILYKTRMKLMGDGLPLQGGIGLELFNNSEFGMTEFAQKVNYQRALQGELARTIMGFDEVQTARVHLVLAEGNLLRRRGTHAKASVWVTLRGNSVLKPEQVNGIQRLVAASVPEIEPSNVTVVNQKGVALSTNNQYRDGFYSGNSALQLKKEIENYFSGKVTDVLDDILGPGKAAVAVDVTLDYAQVQTTRETILPAANQQTGVLVRQRERSSGSEPIAVSTHKTDALAPIPLPNPINKILENDYQTGKEIQQIVTAPGTIKRLSVGIVMPQKRSDVDTAHLQQVVAMAVGLDPTRGDAIAFSAIDSLSTHVDDMTSPLPASTTSSPLSSHKALLGSAIMVAVLLLGSMLILRRRRATFPPVLSESERKRLLAHIKQWLDDDIALMEPVQHDR
jgi:flagellar M-ring protein FliF